MNFFNTLQNSIYSPKFYQTVPKKTLWQSIKYFLLLILLLTVISVTLLFIKNLFIETPILLQNLVQDTINCYPKDLEIKIINGEVSTNAPEPYLISSYSCNTFTNIVGTANILPTLAVIDTKIPFSQSKFEEYNSMIWLTKDALVTKDRGNTTRLYSLTEVKNFTLTKQTLESLYNQFSPYLKFAEPILLLVALLVSLLVYLFRLLQLLLTVSLIWLLGKIFKHELNFSSSYKIGLFAATLGLIVDLIVNATSIYTGFYGFPFMFTITTLGVVIVNVFLPKRSVS